MYANDALYAVAALLLPALSALILVGRMAGRERGALAYTVTVVTYLALALLPMHAAGFLELAGLLPAISYRVVALFALVVLVASYGIARRFPRDAGGVDSSPKEGLPKYLLFAIAIVAALWGLFFLNRCTSYPDGWDGLAYHLPLAVSWMQRQSLAFPLRPDWRFSLPANCEMGMSLLLGTGWEAASAIFNMLAATVSVSSVYLLCNKYTANRQAAIIATLMFASIPMVVFQAFGAYVDLFGTSFLLAASAIYVYRDAPPGRIPAKSWYLAAIFLSGAACGMAVGTKPTFYPYAAVLFAAIAADTFSNRHRIPVGVFRSLATFVVGTLLFCSFWFVRATVYTGNPLYPIRISIGDTVLLDGFSTADITDPDYDLNFVSSRYQWPIYPWIDYKRTNLMYGQGSGLGWSWVWFVTLGVAFALVFRCVVLRRRRRLTAAHAAIAIWLVLAVVWWFALRRMPRFGLPIIALSCVLSADLFDGFVSNRSKLFRWLLLLSVSLGAAICAFAPAHEIAGRVRTGGWSRAENYGYPAVIDTFPDRTTILNLTHSERNNYYLMGNDLSNRIVSEDWAPDVIDNEFLSSNNIDYIVEKKKNDRFMTLPTTCQLVAEEEILETVWRVWKVVPADAD